MLGLNVCIMFSVNNLFHNNLVFQQLNAVIAAAISIKNSQKMKKILQVSSAISAVLVYMQSFLFCFAVACLCA